MQIMLMNINEVEGKNLVPHCSKSNKIHRDSGKLALIFQSLTKIRISKTTDKVISTCTTRVSHSME